MYLENKDSNNSGIVDVTRPPRVSSVALGIYERITGRSPKGSSTRVILNLWDLGESMLKDVD